MNRFKGPKLVKIKIRLNKRLYSFFLVPSFVGNPVYITTQEEEDNIIKSRKYPSETAGVHPPVKKPTTIPMFYIKKIYPTLIHTVKSHDKGRVSAGIITWGRGICRI